MTTAAAITAQVQASLGYAADGTRTLDVPALRAWLANSLNAAIDAGVAVANGRESLKAQVQLSILEPVDRLAAAIAPAHWAGRADWPLSNTAAQRAISGNRTTAVVAAMAAVRSASRRVTADYDAINVGLANKVRNELFDEAFAPMLPVPVLRVIDTRFYLTTLVTDWDEESAPSPVSGLFEVDQNDAVTVQRPLGATDRHINRWRIYRTNSAASTTAFQLVKELPSATASYSDSKKPAELGELLVTTGWAVPPAKLVGLTGMPNGVMAGFIGHVLCFCQPGSPYAWPADYQTPLRFDVVGLKAFGQSLLVGTVGSPYLVSGADSASMTAQELPGSQSCSSAASMAAIENGVLYASPDGICLADGSGVQLVTGTLFTHEDWSALRPASIVAAVHDQVYYFFWNNGTTSGCYALDFVTKKLTQVDIRCSALYSDTLSDTLYTVDNGKIAALFKSPARRTSIYRTGLIKLPQPGPLAWAQVDSDYSAPVTLRWYGDGVLRHSQALTSVTPVRLPPGRYLEHEIEIESQARVTMVTLAGTTSELQTA